MQIITYVMLALAAVAAVDRVTGCRLGLGREFERGITMLGPLTLSMAGMLVIAPTVAEVLRGLGGLLPDWIDLSILPASLLANDMGGAHLAAELAKDEAMGAFNGLVVSSMMGCTISFTIPFAMQAADRRHHSDIIFGILCGMIPIPVGCFAAGVMLGLPPAAVLLDLVPLIVLLALIAVGILRFARVTIAILSGLAWVLRALITAGLFVGMVEFLTGYALLPHMQPLEEAMATILNIACMMTGAFPLLHLLKRALGRPLAALGRRLGVNETAALGFLSTLGSSVTTFEMVDRMDRRGVVLNAAFAAPAAFTFVDHLAFTLSFRAEYVSAVIAGKLIAGVCAVIVAQMFCRRRENDENDA